MPIDSAIICTCTKIKTISDVALPAIEYYNGACVPQLRQYVTHKHPELLERLFFMSGKYGLVKATTIIPPYDLLLTIDRAKEMRTQVGKDVIEQIIEPFQPSKLLAIVTPTYFLPLADLLMHPSRPLIYWEPDVEHGWASVETILNKWF
jgi:cytoplasmic iron level regulating protein YaaA (DUF328/UPF0246 family)